MDTLETYIKMCEKARRFLLPWEAQEGDWFACRNPVTGLHNVYVYQDFYMGCERNEACFPLYRQDQLQEMVRPKDLADRHLAKNFGDWCIHLPATIPNAFASMEQLWLAFVMKEKYNKIWDGEKWHL